MDMCHCNNCSHMPFIPGIDIRRYFITNCGHLLCSCCVTNGTGGLNEQCPVCKMLCKIVEVDQNANSDIKAYFVDASTMICESVKRFMKISAFQKAQARGVQGILKNMYEMCKKLSIENSEIPKLKNENNSLKAKIAAAECEISDLKKKVELQELENQRWIGAGVKITSNQPTGNELLFPILNTSRREGQAFSPAFSTGPFGDRQNSQKFFDTPASGTSSKFEGTPFTIRTQSDQFNSQSSGGSKFFGSGARGTPSPNHIYGRVASRSSSLDRTAVRDAMPAPLARVTTPGFSAAPGAGRPRNGINPGPVNSSPQDVLTSRLRGLRW
ncbi:uncharacterized protein LOC110854154 isoform X2 [Folsomia candida]|uniref:uncharacterized protein LOC110854154 isoform X2 n=1 Tax=Folsomia candida TaxID=158441 RepID=UPI001604B36A|nr:uncharacterized protein LOC110854154 isoform X2 [Folsomia candida]